MWFLLTCRERLNRQRDEKERHTLKTWANSPNATSEKYESHASKCTCADHRNILSKISTL